MANTVIVVQKLGATSLDDRVAQLAKQGWALIGSPLLVGPTPSQVMILDGGDASQNPSYQTVVGTRAEVEQVCSDLAPVGWTMYGDPYDRGGYIAQALIFGDIRINGAQAPGGDGGTTPPPPPAPRLRIRHLTTTDYTPTLADRDYLLVFDVAADVTVTLGSIPGATDDETFSVLAVNTLGRINLEAAPGETLVAFAPHAEQSATIGLTRGGVKWYAAGTNNPVEEG